MSPQLICKIINADPKKYFIYGTKHKNRIKHYLKELIRSYLLIKK